MFSIRFKQGLIRNSFAVAADTAIGMVLSLVGIGLCVKSKQ
jgi:hypothetical protein